MKKTSGNEQINMFIVGAQKAGTTSLKHYLGDHPGVVTHLQKEFAFFYDEEEFNKGKEAAFKKYFGKNRLDKPVVAKNAGLYVNENGIRRLYEHNPDCHLVIILRNPVERAYSAFQMEVNYGNVEDSFEEMEHIIRKKDESDWRYDFFIRMGMYAHYIKNIWKYFPPEKLSLFRFEDLATAPQAICTQLYTTLGVDPSFQPDVSVKYNETRKMRSSNYARFVMKLLHNNNPLKQVARTLLPSQHDYRLGEMLRNVNKSSSTPKGMSPEMKVILSEFYAGYNEELTRLTGIDFSGWNNSLPAK